MVGKSIEIGAQFYFKKFAAKRRSVLMREIDKINYEDTFLISSVSKIICHEKKPFFIPVHFLFYFL
jgi:hypothetical protein